MRIRQVAAAGAALVAVLGFAPALAGCSVHPDAAAVVDGREISPAQVALATEQVAEVIVGPGGTTLPENTILQFLIDAPFYLAAAEEAGVGVTAEFAADAMDENMANRGLEPLAWSNESIEVARYVLVLQELSGLDDGGAAAVGAQEAMLAADVVVNPRYGVRNEETGFIDSAPPAWVVTAESQASGTAQ